MIDFKTSQSAHPDQPRRAMNREKRTETVGNIYYPPFRSTDAQYMLLKIK